jgi:NAD(P)-dependent dehydrogenase (short-subunit alcohol dehydrogenase family)
MPATTPLQNRTALLTGATGGLGDAIATALAARGCKLLLTARGEEGLGRMRERLGGKAKVFAANLANPADIEELLGYAAETVGPIDILINNAGVFPVGPIEESSPEEFDRCFAINVRAPFLLCRACVPGMASRGWGRVVNIGSSSAFAGFKNTSVYCASKHALLGLSRSLHDEFRSRNVKVISVNPGSIQTEMGRQVPNQDFSTFLDPADVAEYVAFMISFDTNIISEEVRLNRLIIR